MTLRTELNVFSTLKKLMSHIIVTFQLLVRAMYIRAERMFIRSICDEPLPINEVLMKKEDREKISSRYCSVRT